MNKHFLSIIILLITFQTIKSQSMDSLSYSIGVVMAQNLKNEGIKDLNTEDMATAFSDVLDGKELKISTTDAKMIFKEYLSKQQERVHAEVKTAGENFLKTNATKEGVQVTASGLQYEVITEGAGPKPSLTDKVNVHYHGTLITGEVFDSSVERGEPISFPLNGVIQGWQEGLQLMNTGSKFRFYIPQELAYGGRGAGALIKPYAALIFDVELLGIE